MTDTIYSHIERDGGLPLLPLSLEGILDVRLRTLAPLRLAGLLDRFLFAEVEVTIERLGDGALTADALARVRPPAAETADRFRAAVHAEGFGERHQAALLLAAEHIAVGEDVIGALVRIARRTAGRRQTHLSARDAEGVLGMEPDGWDVGRQAFLWTARQAGYEIEERPRFDMPLEARVRGAFKRLDEAVGHELDPERRRLLTAASLSLLARVGPLDFPLALQWLEERVGASLAGVIVERLRGAGLIVLTPYDAVTLAYRPLPAPPPSNDQQEKPE